MKILFATDSLFADVSEKVLSHGINAKIRKLSIPGSGTLELGMSVVYRLRSMLRPPQVLLLSVGTNDTKLTTEKFYTEIRKILSFCVDLDIIFLCLPIPFGRLASDEKIKEMNRMINECSYYVFNLDYKHSDLSFDRLHLSNKCISDKLRTIKKVLNLTVSNLAFGNENWP